MQIIGRGGQESQTRYSNYAIQNCVLNLNNRKMRTPKWNSIIVEADISDSNQLKTMLQKHCPNVKVIAEVTETSEAITCINNMEANLLFCNVSLRDGIAFDMLDELGGFYGPLVFLSKDVKSALHSLRYNAFDYFLKPVTASMLLDLMKRLRNWETKLDRRIEFLNGPRFSNKFNTTLLKASGVQHVVHIPDIIHIEGDGNYSTVHLASDDQILVSKPLKYFEDILPIRFFFRVHQSHIVNIATVKSVQNGEEHFVTLHNGSTVPLSRRKKDQFLDWLIQ